MKKALSLLLALILVLSLTACAGNTNSTTAPETTAPAEDTTAAESTEAPTEAPTETLPETEAISELERITAEYEKVRWKYVKDKYEDQVVAYEAQGISKGGIVFFGSSGFTRWSTKYGNTPLEDALPAADGTKICINHGLGGSTVHQLCYYYERMVLAYQPKALVISSYLNDFGKGYTQRNIMTCLEYLCERARTDMPGIRFYITDFRPTAKDKTEGAIQSYLVLNKLISEYCAAHDDCIFVELSKEPFYYNDPKDCGTYKNINTSKYIDDLVHYTPEGYREFAEIWKRVLADELADSTGFVPAK